jgi:hypothetical protein
MDPFPLVDRGIRLVHRWVWLPLSLLIYFAFAASRRPEYTDAGVFQYANRELLSGRGLHLYADHPEVQIGPLGLLAGRIGGFENGHATILSLVCSGLLLVIVLLGLDRIASGELPWKVRSVRMLLIGSSVAFAWVSLVPSTAHVDDALAIACVVWAFISVRITKIGWAGLLLALAIACKPWAIFVVIVVLLPKGRIRGMATLSAASLVVWLPFLVAAPRTLSALSAYRIDTGPASLWALWGLDHPPTYERLLQLGVATAGGWFLWRARIPECIPLWVFGTRLFLDAGTFEYYLAGLVVAAAIVDLADGSQSVRLLRVPLFAPALVALLAAGSTPLAGRVSWGRLLVIAVVVVAGCATRYIPASAASLREGRAHLGHGGIREVTPFGLNHARLRVDA